MFMESEGKKRLIRISVWVAVLSLLLAVVSSLATALSADAHAALRSMSPAAGSTLTKAPTQVALTFSEAVSTSFATVIVTDQDGHSVSSGPPTVAGMTVTQRLGAVGSGRFTVAFRVVSDDGHPVSDRATFTVRLASAATTTSAPPTNASTRRTSTIPGASPGAAATPDQTAGADTGPSSPALLWGLVALVAVTAGAGTVALRRRRARRQ